MTFRRGEGDYYISQPHNKLLLYPTNTIILNIYLLFTSFLFYFYSKQFANGLSVCHASLTLNGPFLKVNPFYCEGPQFAATVKSHVEALRRPVFSVGVFHRKSHLEYPSQRTPCTWIFPLLCRYFVVVKYPCRC